MLFRASNPFIVTLVTCRMEYCSILMNRSIFQPFLEVRRRSLQVTSLIFHECFNQEIVCARLNSISISIILSKKQNKMNTLQNTPPNDTKYVPLEEESSEVKSPLKSSEKDTQYNNNNTKCEVNHHHHHHHHHYRNIPNEHKTNSSDSNGNEKVNNKHCNDGEHSSDINKQDRGKKEEHHHHHHHHYYYDGVYPPFYYHHHGLGLGWGWGWC